MDKIIIDSILLVDDENLFHLVFEDVCSLLNIALTLESVSTAEEAEARFKGWMTEPDDKPEVVFVDLNLVGSSFDGIELIRRINYEYGNGVVIGIISSSYEQVEIANAIQVGAQFWMVKSEHIEPRLQQFKEDYDKYKARTMPFTVYDK